MRNVLLLGSLVSMLLSGCFFRPTNSGGPYYGNRPPPARPMSYQEAVDRGFDECRARQLQCRLKKAKLSHNDSVWKVRMRAVGNQHKGHLFLEYDAYSRDLLRADAKLRPWRRSSPPRWENKDDWDDDNDGVANNKDARGHRASDPKQASSPQQQKSSSNAKSASPPSNKKGAADDDDDDDDEDDDSKGSKKGSTKGSKQ
ncbi:MAG: hypothetical protein M3Y59_00530 [Myxococcota bacterium]|nr:hypothetical protein [Myxococcota bacterium]